MIGEKKRRFVGVAGQRMTAPIEAAIVLLAEACDYARDAKCSVWEFAVEIDVLLAVGLSIDQIRWLIACGYARHGEEITKRGDLVRDFRPARNRKFSKRACFIATDAGLRLTAVVPVESGLSRVA